MDAEAALRDELHRLRRHRPDVSGAVLAGVDGLHIASDLPGVGAEHVAALAAASAGLGTRFAHTVGHGSLRETVVHGSAGYVVCYPSGQQALLAVVAHQDANLARLHPDARALAQRLGEFVDTLWPPPPPPQPAPTQRPPVDSGAPLASRTPRATPHGARDGYPRPTGY